jgi:hypothetical protein
LGGLNRLFNDGEAGSRTLKETVKQPTYLHSPMPKRRPPGRAVSSRDRATDFRATRERILIVCEGEKTEPNYFRALIAYHRLNTVFVDTDEGRQLESP